MIFISLALTGACRRFRCPGILILLALLGVPAAALAQFTIADHPQPQIVRAGQSANFNVVVATKGPGPYSPISYQWRRNGYAIPGATGMTLSLPNVSQGDNDHYDVVVTMGSLTAISRTARLLVTPTSYPARLEVDNDRSEKLHTTDTGTITTHEAASNGRYYLAGSFNSTSGGPITNLARFHSDSTLDTTFIAPTFDATPKSLAVQPDGKIIVAGAFRNVGGASAGGIVRLNVDGSRDSSFVVGTGFANDSVTRVVLAADGSIYVLGTADLGSYNGSASLGAIARLASTGALDASFTSPVFRDRTTVIVYPLNLLPAPGGTLYVQGYFTQIDGTGRRVTKWPVCCPAGR